MVEKGGPYMVYNKFTIVTKFNSLYGCRKNYVCERICIHKIRHKIDYTSEISTENLKMEHNVASLHCTTIFNLPPKFH